MEENEKLPVEQTGEEITQVIAEVVPVEEFEDTTDAENTELGDVDSNIKGLDFVEEE